MLSYWSIDSIADVDNRHNKIEAHVILTKYIQYPKRLQDKQAMIIMSMKIERKLNTLREKFKTDQRDLKGKIELDVRLRDHTTNFL